MIKRNIPSLTGFRAVAAYSVLLAHSLDTAFSYGGKISPMHTFNSGLAYFGMTTFFVLSGFVITYNYSDLFKSRNWFWSMRYFLIARFARLYPLYIIFLFVSLGSLSANVFTSNWLALVSYLTLTQSWFNLQMIAFPPAWSISTETYFYFAFLLIPFFYMTFSRRVMTSVVVFFLVVVYCVFAVLNSAVNEFSLFLTPYFANPTSPDVLGWLTYFSPYVRIFEFVIGSLAAKFYMAAILEDKLSVVNTSRMSLIVTIACVTAILWLHLVGVCPQFGGEFVASIVKNFAFAPFLGCLMYITCRYNNFLTKLLSNRVVIFCGEISYSVYIIQFWVYSLFGSFTALAPSPAAYIDSSVRVSLFFLFTTIFSYGSYHLLEVPCRKWAREILSKCFLS